ncbi:TPA: elongation factor P [Candidatus Berkelbacteria bacterium]|uniref:Elongation factor P n=1 Tax=Berkelbacteria bacterium GW2011_GWE1_39_12 TaxID=1618337 RepID=A0A0G4B2M9_9BACT|nr:MAG: elongation factor P [Berkelbacteria bacterium GW2011_GWE1_39_12]HBO60721.1 elongation factor P [Candidatus Berkelbacteria bacterium]
MLTISDLKIGTKIIFNDEPHQVIFAQHSKQGRAGAVLRSKLKNLLNGATVDHTFAGAEKIEEAELQLKKAQYLYKAEEPPVYFFMDPTDFEQFSLTQKQVAENGKFLKEGEEVDILYYDGEAINIQLPIKIKMKITYTEPGFKGNSASTVQKPATLETGAQVNVPLFIKENDEVIVDTRDGSYVERA